MPSNNVSRSRSCHVVAMAVPGRGHINPMMNFCKLLASRRDDVLITFVVTEEWLGLIGSDSKPDNIRFGTIPNVTPSERVRATNLLGFLEAVMTKMEDPFEQLLKRLETPVTTILADTFLFWAVSVGNRMSIPVASFFPMSASVFSMFHHFDLLVQNGHHPIDISGGSDNLNYFQWLDSQPCNSVLYVSFGSVYSVSSAQVDEIAAGLRDSGVRFLWVARGESSRGREMCGEMGLVVPWCNQLKVLSHSSIGGFWTHCGWNSTVEGLFSGLPFLTFPLGIDQVSNSKAAVEDWKIGWRVKGQAGVETLVKREEICWIVKRFMNLESNEGKEIRSRARKLQKICQEAAAKGGSSETNVDAFIRYITQLPSH
ncbi:UDP-glycosyltransferase 87A2 [Vitis vinifera]|uniref:UDP-glycosyltransferase 87A2 n=1 Tax=Vitis vinifera TaxID=29760 RepID=A0A438KP98_VITVI|nr:UDP-glycosyltransferase 87A2 [Vitis vinifera]